jgi:hypothetical protein
MIRVGHMYAKYNGIKEKYTWDLNTHLKHKPVVVRHAKM